MLAGDGTQRVATTESSEDLFTFRDGKCTTKWNPPNLPSLLTLATQMTSIPA